ncbi:MAG: UDP-N-acetylmuramoyl-L-alanyl-D-glutamate--2,6-diaminopimelate ligase [Planctomycetota bacterium]
MLGLVKMAGAWAGLGRSTRAEVRAGTRRRRRDFAGAWELPQPPARRSLRDLKDLRHVLGKPEVHRFRNAEIKGLADHSARVEEGFLFFAVPGLETDGASFAREAVNQGAVAIISARPLSVPVPVFLVPDVRRAASRAASSFFRRPSSRVPVIGVTGTNGKSTVTDLLSLCLEDDALPVGSLGTIAYRLADPAVQNGARAGRKILHGRTTTPGPIDLQRYLHEMIQNGVRRAVVEVSSHALDQGRTEAVDFAAAVFTNLTQDHLDYHGSMAAYAEAKASLFRSLRPGALAVLPADDPSAQPIFAALPEGVRLVTYGHLPCSDENAFHVSGEVLRSDLRGTLLRVRTPEGCAEIELPLVGSHNVRNALAAIACSVGMGIGTLRSAEALRRARPVRGRLERVDRGQTRFPIFVDYAHTPDALRQVLSSLKPLTERRLRVVFGCGGERDRSKRPIMGRIATEIADDVVLTDDNPRRESSEHILEEIRRGVSEVRDNAAKVHLCPNRRAAIRHALDRAAPGDIVVLAGKGHEQGQIVGDRVLPFDDRTEVEEWLCRS